MRDALRIQDRFVAEPLFAKIGRDHLKSEGVSTLQKIKSNFKSGEKVGFLIRVDWCPLVVKNHFLFASLTAYTF